jgi:peroxiredoxin
MWKFASYLYAAVLLSAQAPTAKAPAQKSEAPAEAQGLSGRRAPSFTLPDSNLKAYDILDFRGHWLLLDFMKTDCPRCKALTQILEQVKRHVGNRAAIISVVEPPDNTATVAKYIAEMKTTIPIVFDYSQTAIFYFKATPARPSFDTPHLFAIDPNGMIVRDWSEGAQGLQSFQDDLEKLINGGAGKK